MGNSGSCQKSKRPLHAGWLLLLRKRWREVARARARAAAAIVNALVSGSAYYVLFGDAR